MAYSAAVVTLHTQSAGQVGFKTWILDTPDNNAAVVTAGYISDGIALGMEKGDMVIYRQWTTAVPAATSEKTSAEDAANILLETSIMFVHGANSNGTAVDLTGGNVVALT